MDVKKLTDDELDREIARLQGNSSAMNATAPSPTDNVKALSDADLDARILELQGKGAKDPVLQEMHPEFTAADRLVVKNFSNNNEAAVNYLQKRHPNLEIKVDDKSGQFLARARDGSEEAYRVLDPDTGFFSSPGEMLRDVGDIGTDIVSGIGTGLATAAGGVAGAAGGGIGALPGAALAGAGASAGLEGLKQSIGKALGVGEFSGTDLAIAGGAGAVSPLLFGTGASAAQVAKAGLDDAALAAQKGGLGRAADWAKSSALPWLGEKVSGVSSSSIKGLASNFDDIVRMEKDPSAITNMSKETIKDVSSSLRGAKQAAWKEYQGALDATGDTLVDITPARDRLLTAIKEAEEAAAVGTAADDELVEALRGQLGKYFQAKDGSLKSHLPAKAAAKLDQRLGEAADFKKLSPEGPQVGPRFSQGDSSQSLEVKNLSGELKSLVSQSLDEALPEGALAARARYGEIANLEKQVKPLLKGSDKTYRTLRNLGRPANQAKQELFQTIDQEFGTNLIDKARLAETYAAFAKPASLPISSQGTTSTSRSIPLAAAGGLAGYYAGGQMGGSGHGSGVMGAGIGGSLGAFLGGPAAIRQYIRAGLAAQKATSKLPNVVGPAVGKETIENVWLRMKGD